MSQKEGSLLIHHVKLLQESYLFQNSKLVKSSFAYFALTLYDKYLLRCM